MQRLITLEKEIQEKNKSSFIGKQLQIFDNVDSTNNIARTLASNGAKDGTCIVALSQSAGRGRLGRFFSSMPGGLYASFILRPSFTNPTDVLKLTSMIAVAAARAIEDLYPVQVGIKWVNDLYIDNKKIAGILCEGCFSQNSYPDFFVCGIGINVQSVQFPQELSSIATSLEAVTGIQNEPLNILPNLMMHIDTLYPALGDGLFLKESKARSVLIGKDIIVHENGIDYSAKALDIDHLGQLIISASGELRTLCSGEVSVHLS